MQSGKILDDGWLEEAAAAFQVATTYKKMTCTEEGLQVTSTRRMRREQVVDAVVLKVGRVRAELDQKNPAPDCLP